MCTIHMGYDVIMIMHYHCLLLLFNFTSNRQLLVHYAGIMLQVSIKLVFYGMKFIGLV